MFDTHIILVSIFATQDERKGFDEGLNRIENLLDSIG